MAKVIPCDTRTFHWKSPDGRTGTFRPSGKLFHFGEGLGSNPERWQEEGPMWSARLFVGFNVGGVPTWNINDLVTLVRRVREKQKRTPDASFLIQKGIYKSKTGQVVEEDGAQVIVLNLENVSKKKFRKEIIELADVIVDEFQQELVIVEFQRGGISRETVGVEP